SCLRLPRPPLFPYTTLFRSVVELAAAGGTAERPVTAERLATAQSIPPKFLESILLQLRRGAIVHSQRGPDSGYWLAKPANEIALDRKSTRLNSSHVKISYAV